MNILQAIILGVVEGITEFLPISSTYHLIMTSIILGIEQTDFVKLFTVFIQSGAILAVVLMYWKELVTNRDLIIKILASFIPTVIVGLLLFDLIKGVFFESYVTSTYIFILVGIIFILVELLIGRKVIRTKKDVTKLTLQTAVIIGLIQSLSVFPGVSRAGAVMIGMMLFGFRRDEAAKYSFMLAIPTILGATVYDLYEMREVVAFSGHNVLLLGVGFIVSLVSAYFGVRWLIRYLQTNTLTGFGIYRLILGILFLLFFV